MTDSKKNIARKVARLPQDERNSILGASDSDLPAILRNLGISIPATTWVLRILKVILYAAGIILAGIGTAQAATITTALIY